MTRLAAQQGDHMTALEHVQTIWSAMRGQSTDATVEIARTLRTCYVFFRDHNDSQAGEVLKTACTQLRRRAATIDDPSMWPTSGSLPAITSSTS